MSKNIAIARGDGIGPEIMAATLKVLKASGVDLSYDEVTIGKDVYEQGHTTGITPESWQTLLKNRILLKAPITTPQGGGYKSLNVALRTSLSLYANVRPCVAYAPFISTKHPNMDVVVVRENEEDLYTGIEHQQTPEVVQCLKLISVPGCERIIRHAFEYARKNNRRKVTCMIKDNIMKQTDGLFHRVFDRIGQEYPDIEQDHAIIDIGAARLADNPGNFDVVVTLNLYGDIISDITAEVAGSVGLAGSANIGDSFAMFEAIHGSAPDIAGQDKANPSGLLLAAVMMLVHLGEAKAAGNIHNAWLRTIEQGIHTADIYDIKSSVRLVGTEEFANAVIANLGNQPKRLPSVEYNKPAGTTCYNQTNSSGTKGTNRELTGVDVFVYSEDEQVSAIADAVKAQLPQGWELTMISNRGTKVWPEPRPQAFAVDHWRCRIQAKGFVPTKEDVARLVLTLTQADIDVIKTENLYNFDGVAAYSS